MACTNNHQCGRCPHPCSSEVKDIEHMKWYASLSVSDKTLVTGLAYPACTTAWNSWTQDERQQAIARSGIIRAPRNKQNALGHDF